MATPESYATTKTHKFKVKRELEITRADALFAPGVEELKIDYTIKGLKGNEVSFKITSATHPNNPVYQQTLTAEEKTSGAHTEFKWDGKANCSDGPLKDQWIDPLYSPYKVVLESDQGQQDEEEFKVEVKEITLSIDGLDVDKLVVNVPQSDTEVTAQVQLKQADGTGVATPVLLKVDFSYTDPSTDNATHTASFQYDGTNYLGKRTDAAALHWAAHADCAATSSDAFKTKCQVEVITSGAALGQAKVNFKSAAVGGDDYKLKAVVLGHDGTTELVSQESNAITIWRKIDFANVRTMDGENYIDAATVHAEIGPAFETSGYVQYSRQAVVSLAAALTVKYIGLYKVGGGMKDWPADFSPANLEATANELEPTADELAKYAYAGADAAQLADKAAAKTAIEAKAQAWFNAIVADYSSCVSDWFAAVTLPAGNVLLAVQYYHPKLSNAGDGLTTFWPAGISINLANPGSGLDTQGHPDVATWREVQGFNRGQISVIFKNYGTAARLQIVCRHEIAHGTRSAFKRKDFGVGDHSASALMTPYGGSNTFSNADILLVRGYD